MSDARVRLLQARQALSRAENSVGLRGRVAIEESRSPVACAPVLQGPAERGQLIRLLIDGCPLEGWIGLCGVGHIGWEWAQKQGMDLDRVLVLNPGEGAIIAIGQVRRLPWEHRGEIALRDVMTLSLSFDHRFVDGEQGSRFLADVGAILRRPGLTLTMV